jgi:GPH family glycoside/pentoside/hexuronide:cation symporter
MPLQRRTKAGYGAADFGLSGAELLLQLYLLEFYIRVVGLSPALAGMALAIGTFWDAVTDPLMGGVLDRTRTRWGRFVPYLFAGAILVAVGIFALFHPPAAMTDWVAFGYLSTVYVFLNTGMTILGVPHLALGGALSPDTHERTELFGWRLVFGTFGLFAGILAPLLAAMVLQIDVLSTQELYATRSLGSVFIAVAVLVFTLITIFMVSQRTRRLPSPPEVFHWKAFWLNIGHVLRNPLFVPFFMAFILVGVARSMNATLALPYYKESLGLTEAEVQGPILSVFTLFIVLSVPFWTVLGRRFGKKRPAFWGLFLLGAMTMAGYPFFPPGSLVGPVLVAIFGGVAVGAIILVESLVTDMADADFVRSGQDREGIYFGFWRMGQKVARSVTLGLTGLILSAIGYEEAVQSQSPETQRALAWVFGFGVGSLFCLASFVFLRTPLDKKRQEKIQADKQARLAAMEGQRDATFSGQPLPRSEGLDLSEKDVGG